jgi:hypothetical protein
MIQVQTIVPIIIYKNEKFILYKRINKNYHILISENGNEVQRKNFYKNQKEDILVICDECNKETTLKNLPNINKSFICKSCRTLGQRNGMYGKRHTEEESKKQSERQKQLFKNGHKQWNEGLTKETDPRLMESSKKQSESHKGDKNYMFGKSFYDVWVEKYGENVANEKYEKWKNKISYASDGINNHMFGKSFYDVWVEKYGENVANEKYEKWKNNCNLAWESLKNDEERFLQYRLKISQTLKKRVFTEEHLRNLSISGRKRIYKSYGSPNYNPSACKYFNQLMEQTNTFIQHAENGGEFYIKDLGYWVDGYDQENNVVYEYDEKRHFRLGQLKEKDIKRQQEIEEFLNCKFIRVKDEKI